MGEEEEVTRGAGKGLTRGRNASDVWRDQRKKSKS